MERGRVRGRDGNNLKKGELSRNFQQDAERAVLGSLGSPMICATRPWKLLGVFRETVDRTTRGTRGESFSTNSIAIRVFKRAFQIGSRNWRFLFCKEYTIVHLYNSTFIQKRCSSFDLFDSLHRIHLTFVFTFANYSLQIACLFLLEISQVLEDPRIFCICFMIDLQCEFYCSIDFLYIFFFSFLFHLSTGYFKFPICKRIRHLPLVSVSFPCGRGNKKNKPNVFPACRKRRLKGIVMSLLRANKSKNKIPYKSASE